MCRLAAWLGAPVALEDVVVKPAHSLIEQSQHANEAKLSVNGDGFGFAWYSETGQLGLYKAVLPAWTDDNLLSLTAVIKSTLFLAHVRASTYGHLSRSNCHPFTSGRWSFVHNGQIADFSDIRRSLETSLSDEQYAHRTGHTDSELLFLLLLDHGLEHNVQKACYSVLDLLKTATCKSKKATRIAAVFSDGESLYALRFSSDSRSPSLYLCHKNEGTLIASEPLNNDAERWEPIAESSLTTIRRSKLQSHDVKVQFHDMKAVS